MERKNKKKSTISFGEASLNSTATDYLGNNDKFSVI
jgi:hypothetical protein